MDISTATGRLMLAVIGAVGQAARWPCWSGNASGLHRLKSELFRPRPGWRTRFAI